MRCLVRRVQVQGPDGTAVTVREAATGWERMRGLIGRPAEEGCLLRPCWAVHMVGVGRALDVVWLDRAGRVLRVDAGVLPGWRVRACWGAYAALELPAGTVRRLGWRPGHRLEIRPVPEPAARRLDGA